MGAAPRRLRPHWVAVWVVLFVVFLGELLGYAWVRMQCVQTGYEISQLVQEQQRLSELQANLKIELARLKAPQRIARIAGEQLGMTLPSARQIVVLP